MDTYRRHKQKFRRRYGYELRRRNAQFLYRIPYNKSHKSSYKRFYGGAVTGSGGGGGYAAPVESVKAAENSFKAVTRGVLNRFVQSPPVWAAKILNAKMLRPYLKNMPVEIGDIAAPIVIALASDLVHHVPWSTIVSSLSDFFVYAFADPLYKEILEPFTKEILSDVRLVSREFDSFMDIKNVNYVPSLRGTSAFIPMDPGRNYFPEVLPPPVLGNTYPGVHSVHYNIGTNIKPTDPPVLGSVKMGHVDNHYMSNTKPDDPKTEHWRAHKTRWTNRAEHKLRDKKRQVDIKKRAVRHAKRVVNVKAARKKASATDGELRRKVLSGTVGISDPVDHTPPTIFRNPDLNGNPNQGHYGTKEKPIVSLPPVNSHLVGNPSSGFNKMPPIMGGNEPANMH